MEFEDCVVHEIGGQLKLQSSLLCISVCVDNQRFRVSGIR